VGDSLIPPIMIELGGSAADAIKAITSTVAAFEDLTEAAAAMGDAVDEVFASLDAGVESFTAIRDAAKSASTSMRSMATSTASVATAADDAAEAIDTGFAAMAEASASMAEAVKTASAEASEGLASMSEEAKASGVSMDALGEDIVASMREAAAAVAEAAGEIKAAAVEMGESVEASAAEAGEATEGLGSKFLGLGEMSGLLKAAVPLSIAAIGYESVKAATTFQSSTTRLVTSAGEISSNLGMVRSGMLSMAGQVGVSADNLSQAMYYVEAAGFHAASGLTVLKAAAQGAAAEGADTTTVAQALTDVLVDYHKPAADAADVTSQMIAAVAGGKTNLQDFSAAFASIVPAASAAGISFPDVSAALAEMTNHGFTAQRASTDLAQALRSLLNPTTPMKDEFDALGVSTATLHDKLSGPNGLTDAMEYLSQAATKAGKEGTPAFAAALKLLMGTAPGANAALATVGANFTATTAGIKAISGASADAQGNVRGFALVQKNLGQQLKDLKAGFDALLIRIGDGLIPALSGFISFVQSHATPVLSDLGKAISGIASGFSGSAGKAPTAAPGQGLSARMSEGAGSSAPPPQLTAWQQIGQTLKTVADDVSKFVEAAGRLGAVLVKTVGPALATIVGGAVLGALSILGSILSTAVTPALKGLADFAEKHKTIMDWIVVAFLAPLALRLGALAVIKPITAIAGLAKSIVMFPINQSKQIWSTLFGSKGVTDAEGNVTGQVEGFFPKVRRIFKSGFASLQSGWKKLFATQEIKDEEGNVVGEIQGFFPKLLTKFKSGWTSLAGAAKSGWMKLFATQDVTDEEGNVVGQVQGFFPKLAGKFRSGFSSLVGAVKSGWGKVFGAQEATDEEGNVIPAVDGFFPTILGKMKTGWASLAQGAQSGWAAIFGAEAMEDEEGNAVPAVEGLFSKLGGVFSTGWSTLQGGAKTAWQGILNMKNAITGLKGAEELATGAADEEAVATGELDIAMDANPIGLIVIAIGLLVVAFIYCWTHFAAFRDFWKDTWKLIQGAASDAWDLIKSCFDGIVSAVGTVVDFVKSHWQLLLAILTGPIGLAVYAITHYWGDIKKIFDDGWNAVVSAGETAARWMEALPGRIMGWFSGAASWLVSAGQDIMSGLWNGIQSMGSWIAGAIMGLIKDVVPGPVLKILGINSPSKVFHDIGLGVTEGLVNGLVAGGPSTAAASTRMAKGVIAAGSRAMISASSLAAVGSGGLAAAGAAAGGGAPVINITIQGTVVSEKNLRDQIQKAFLQLGMRNSKTWAPYTR
jgi:TP901 family phage tail tape measure protein